MKIFNILLIVIFLAAVWSCNEPKAQGDKELGKKEAISVSLKDANASNPYITSSDLGYPVLCWTEELPQEDGFVVKFSVFDPDKARFGEILTVAPSIGTSAHPENMNKLAFKSDGTIISVFSKKHPTKENRFAGSILYTQSFDQGRSWTSAEFIHSDTSSSIGRGYFDLATLPDGEVGAVWLDGRYGDGMKGSALFFAKTSGKTGFGEDSAIGEGTCECCRTDLYVDRENNLNIVYRDILNDSIRDIVHQYSFNNGETFSEPRRISNDNWIIEGCPHTGPSLASNSAGLHAVWFTAGGAPGIYFTSTSDQGETFTLRNKVSENARHPQMASLPDDRLVLVWDEMQDFPSQPIHADIHQAGAHAAPTSGSKVVMQIRRGTGVLETFTLSDPDANASYPVLTLVEGKTLVAWSQQSEGKSSIYYKWLDLVGGKVGS